MSTDCSRIAIFFPQQEDNCAMVVETSGVDGEPGEEEVVGENLETSAAYICKVCPSPSYNVLRFSLAITSKPRHL